MKLYKYLRSAFKIGDSITQTRIITQQELQEFSKLTHDHNPVHKNPPAVVHGAFLNGLVAGIIGTSLPGPGTLVTSQNFSFPAKCYAGIPLHIKVELVDVRKIIKVKYKCEQNNSTVFEGEARLVMQK